MHNFEIFIRSLFFQIGFTLSTILYAPIALMSFPFSFTQRYRFINLWSRFNIWWLKVTCKINYEIDGLENIDNNRTCIVMANHQSAWETLALSKHLPPLVWIIKKELLFIPFFGWGLALLKPIALQRKKAKASIQQLVEQGQKRLDSGYWVLVFPEGTRVSILSEQPYKRGGMILAEKTAYPILPIAHNSGHFWINNSFFKKPGTIKVSIGPIIETQGKSEKEILQTLESWLRAEVKRLENV